MSERKFNWAVCLGILFALGCVADEVSAHNPAKWNSGSPEAHLAVAICEGFIAAGLLGRGLR
jgi:hypothetical protein